MSDPDHQRTLGFIGAGIAAVAIAGWTVYVHFSAPGGTPIVATGPVTIGIPPEKYAADLIRLVQEFRDELARTHRVDRDKNALLEKQLAADEAKLQNLEQARSDDSAKLAEASQALSKGDTAAAEALFIEAHAQGKAQAAPGNEKAADAAFQLGQLAYQRIDYARAYDHYLEAAKLQPDNPEYLNMAGEITHDLGRYAEARTFYEKALAIRENALDPEHPDVAGSLNNLAALYHAQGQYEKAEPLYQRALGIWEKSLGREHPHVAASLNNLAVLFQTQGRYEEAEPLHLRALRIREQALGEKHPDFAQTLNNLGKLYLLQAQYTRAERLLQRALDIWEKSPGPSTPIWSRASTTWRNSIAPTASTRRPNRSINARYGSGRPRYLQTIRISLERWKTTRRCSAG